MANYRRDIDGLRALAVSSVVAYHVGVPGFRGGFVGVDVFFVISGFLITTLLLAELRERGSVDLLAFYARRVRRLLPAFFVVVLVTLVLGAVFLVPIDGEQAGLAQSAAAAAVYLSNLFFAFTTGGYFDDSSDLMPLLHTWSLAVEEQFYLVWPLLLIGCAWVAGRGGARLTQAIAAVLVVVIAVSLACSWRASHGSAQAAHVAFFMLLSRAWELGLGALLALALPRVRPSKEWPGAVMTLLGIVAIVAAATTFKQGKAFPGIAALLPVAGAVMAIAGGWLTPRSAPARLLSSKPMVAIGVLSYSWYLWHWPLLALTRARELGIAEPWRDGAVALAALGLAWLTYTYIEQPIRTRKVLAHWSMPRVLGAGAAASVAVLAVSLGLYAYAEAAKNSGAYLRFAEGPRFLPACRQSSHEAFERLQPASSCTSGPPDAPMKVVVWGDSHARHVAPMIETAGRPYRVAVLTRSLAGCVPVFDVTVRRANKDSEACGQFNEAVFAEIEGSVQRGEQLAVVLSARWMSYLGVNGTGEAVLTLTAQSNAPKVRLPALAHGLATTIGRLTQRGVKVLVMADVPGQRFSVPHCLARRPVSFCSVDRKKAEQTGGPILQALKEAAGSDRRVHIWDPLPLMCDAQRCLVERDGIILYRDDNHLSMRGSLWLAPAFAEEAAWLAREPGAAVTARAVGSSAEPVQTPSELVAIPDRALSR